MRERLWDLAALLFGLCVGELMPPPVMRVGAVVVLLALLAVIAHLCNRALRLLLPAVGAAREHGAALARGRLACAVVAPSRRRLLAWLARRRQDSHTGPARRDRRPHHHGFQRYPAAPPHGPD